MLVLSMNHFGNDYNLDSYDKTNKPTYCLIYVTVVRFEDDIQVPKNTSIVNQYVALNESLGR